MKVFGIILIIAGIAMFIYRGVTFTKKEKVIDVGPIEVTKEEPKTISWPYYAGGLAVIAGIALIAADRKKR